LAAAVVPNNIAEASPLTVSCAKWTVAGGQNLRQCTGPGVASTGPSGFLAWVLAGDALSHVSITWKKGRTSDIDITSEVTGTRKCPTQTGAALVGGVAWKGTVSGGTAKKLVGGAADGYYCAYTADGFGLVRGLGAQQF
jgi:hypothetical protein